MVWGIPSGMPHIAIYRGMIMYCIGMDCSIRDVAFAEVGLSISMHYSTGLSLKSKPDDYMQAAYDVTRWLECVPDTFNIYVDYTLLHMRARQAQMRLNSLLIGAVLAYSNAISVKFIEPKKVRGVLGLKSSVSKEVVYSEFDTHFPQYSIEQHTIHHVKDAVVLSALAKEDLL